MRFENQQDLEREKKAVEFYVNLFNGSFEKLDENDVDFKIYDKEKNLISFVEVKGRKKNIDDAFPLPVAARKLVKLADKKINPVIIWSCKDGIICGELKNLKGLLRWGGRIPRNGSTNDQELMAYFTKKEKFKIYKQINMEQKINTGAIFKNNYKKAETHPDYKGKMNVEGLDKEVALWVRETKNGEKFFSMAISEPYKASPIENVENKSNDDLPF